MAENETANLPAVTEDDLRAVGFPGGMPMSTGLAVFFNEALYNKCARIAKVMSGAEGVTPKHLLGKPEACFAILSRAITWNLDPFACAQATYQTPGGAIGFMGVLVQAILENSGKLEGGLQFKHEGDWSKVKGKFKIMDGKSGGKYPVPTWGPEDAKGLSVVVSAKVKGEVEARVLRIDLDECFPLNSPLWATSPSTQICYLGARRFGNVAMPGVLFGVPFDVDPTNFYGEPMTDITPKRPERNEFTREPKATAATGNGAGAPKAETAAEGQPEAQSAQANASGVPEDKRRADDPQQGQGQNHGNGMGEKTEAKTATDATVTKPEAKKAEPEPEAENQDTGQQPEDQSQERHDPEESAAAAKQTSDASYKAWLNDCRRELQMCAGVREVADLQETVNQQIRDADLDQWTKDCTARMNAIMSKPPPRKPAQGTARR